MVAHRHRMLAAAREAAGYTQETLAAALRVDRSMVQRWEAGHHAPWAYLWPRLARLPVAEAPPPSWQNDPTFRLHRSYPRRLVLGIPAGLVCDVKFDYGSSEGNVRTPVRAALLKQYESLTDSYRRIDYHAGARAVYGDTAAHLDRLLRVADRVPSKLRRRYIALLGDTAQLAAWLAIDGQDYPTARHFCSIALSSAEEGDDPTLHAYALGVRSYIYLHGKRGIEALRPLEGALRVADAPRFAVNPAVRSWLYLAMAEACALAGDRRGGAKALMRAEQLFDSVRQDGVPRWLGFFNAQEHAARLKGRCLMRLGDDRGAIATLQTACESLPERYVRERSGTLIDLATAQLMEGYAGGLSGPEAAADTLHEAWRLALLTNSGRNQRRVRELLPAFKPYAHLENAQA